MPYLRPALQLREQVQKLRDAGLGGDPETIERRLVAVGYHRLKPYWHPFRTATVHGWRLQAGTSIDDIWDRYVFDRELRVIVADALERIEISARASWVASMVEAHGPLGYASARGVQDYRELDEVRRRLWQALSKGRREPTVQNFERVHGPMVQTDPDTWPPLWTTAELLSFGELAWIVRRAPRPIRKAIGHRLDLPEPAVHSWLHAFSQVRNVCAHHARLWNREFGVSPTELRRPDWRAAAAIGPTRVFRHLNAMAHVLLAIAPGSKWAHRLRALVARHPNVALADMGCPADWQAWPAWSKLLANEDR